MSGRYSSGCLLLYLYIIFLIYALIADGNFGLILKILAGLIPIFYLIDEIRVRRSLSYRAKEAKRLSDLEITQKSREKMR